MRRIIVKSDDDSGFCSLRTAESSSSTRVLEHGSTNGHDEISKIFKQAQAHTPREARLLSDTPTSRLVVIGGTLFYPNTAE